MADKESRMVAEFVDITGAEANQAKFYLEASNWNLKVAMDSYYGSGDDDFAGGMFAETPSQSSFTTDSHEVSDTKRPHKEKTTFASSADYFRANDDDDDEEESGQEFYAGGSEKSGQVIKGPPKRKSASAVAESVFKEAKAHGAESISLDELQEQKKKEQAFAGSGYRLGDEEGPSVASVGGEDVQLEETEKDNVNIYFWANGFSLDDGPLRDPNDPVNKQFLDEASKGYVPSELTRMARNKEVSVNLVDKHTEDYVKPKQVLKAFSGSGHMLGSDEKEADDEQSLLDASHSSNYSWWFSIYNVIQLFVMRLLVTLGITSPTPKVVSQSRAATTSTPDTSKSDVKTEIDDSQPTTSITIRLSDGTRLVAKFNHTSTVGDIRQFVNRARPLPAGTKFNLMTTFPNKILDDDSVTVENGNLLNSVIMQRLI